ncbi:MAG: N-6 DNA methylase [Planctomycetaceae bacterium]|nr:N-6 DNA methylase [Planctomycetaceae bacterium]
MSKPLMRELEKVWQASAADLLAQGVVSCLAEVEVAARREVERTAFDILAGKGDSAGGLASLLRGEDAPVEVLETIHLHLLSRGLERTGDGKIRCRTARRHRRSQGIYYTPDYVAEYLTARCLSGWRGPSPPRVFDPACGCGRFLVTAARQLLQQSHGAVDVAHCLHGCDLDEEAVEVARRVLSLTLMPHGSNPTDRAAITAGLEANVVCANALVEDVWKGNPIRGAARGVREGVEGTTSVVSPRSSSSLQPPVSGLPSFDIVLGNPPYRRELGTKDLLDRIAESDFGRRYRTPRMDLWYYFLHRSIELLAPGGRLGFVVGAYWSAGRGAARLITSLRETVHVEEIFQLDRLQVFPGVAGRHMMLVLAKPPSAAPTTVRLPVLDEPGDARPYVEGSAEVRSFTKLPAQLFRNGLLDLEPPAERLLDRLARFPTLGQLGKIRQGIAENPAAVTKAARRKHGELWPLGEGVFALTPEELERLDLPPAEQEPIRPYHDLCDLGRYERAEDPSLRLIYSTRETWPRLGDCPILAAHLARFRPIMEARRETRQGIRTWWQLHWPREAWIWEQAKLIALQMARRPSFVPSREATYTSFSTNVFVPDAGVREDLHYFAAILNSRLLWKWFRHHAKRRGVGLEINGHVLARAPIRRIDFTSPAETAVHDRLVGLVDRMLDLSHCRRTSPEDEIEAQWRETDGEIDRNVYRLYGLANEEIAAVEEAC